MTRAPTEMELRCAAALTAKMVEYHGASPAHVEALDYVLAVIDELRKPTSEMISSALNAVRYNRRSSYFAMACAFEAALNAASPPQVEPGNVPAASVDKAENVGDNARPPLPTGPTNAEISASEDRAAAWLRDGIGGTDGR